MCLQLGWKSKDVLIRAERYLKCQPLLCNSHSPLFRSIKNQTQCQSCLKAQSFPVKVFFTSFTSAGVACSGVCLASTTPLLGQQHWLWWHVCICISPTSQNCLFLL